MIKVQVKRFISYDNQPILTIELEEGSDIRSMAEKMGIGLEEICALSVNGKQAMLDQILRQDDKVYFIPPIGGG
jgi:molybdopterin converting factor small subunit